MTRLYLFLILFLALLIQKVYAQNHLRRDTLLYIKSVKYELTDPYLSDKYADSIIRDNRSRPHIKSLAYVQKSKFFSTKNDFLQALKMLDSAQLIAQQTEHQYLNQIIEAERLRDSMNFNLISLNNLTTKLKKIDTNKTFYCPGNTPIINNLGIQRIYFYYIWTNSLQTDTNVANTSIKLINQCIEKNLNYLKQRLPDTFNAYHNLAKLYYAKAQAFEAKTFKSQFNVQIINTIYTDSIQRAYSMSNYYDDLLKNRQAWSRFSHALYLLAVYANDSQKKFLLDSSKKLIINEIRYLFPKTYDSILNKREFKKSYDLDTLYLFQKYQTLKTLASLYALQGNFKDYFYYTKIASFYYDQVKQQLINTIQQQNSLLVKQNKFLKESKKSQTAQLIVIIQLTLIITLILLILNYILNKKNHQISEKNKEILKQHQKIQQLKKKHETFVNCYSHKIKNNIYHLERRIIKGQKQSEVKNYFDKLERQIKLLEGLSYHNSQIELAPYTLNADQIKKLLNENILEPDRFIINNDLNAFPSVKIELFELIFSEIITNAAKYNKDSGRKIEIKFIKDYKPKGALLISSCATYEDFNNIQNAIQEAKQISETTKTTERPKSQGIFCIINLIELYSPGFDVKIDFIEKTQTLQTYIIFQY